MSHDKDLLNYTIDVNFAYGPSSFTLDATLSKDSVDLSQVHCECTGMTSESIEELTSNLDKIDDALIPGSVSLNRDDAKDVWKKLVKETGSAVAGVKDSDHFED